MVDQDLSNAEAEIPSDEQNVCIVCFSDFKTNMRAKLPCGHDDICGVCHLRLRHLHDDKKCPICKTPNDTVIVDNDETKTFEDYPRWGDDIGAGFAYKADVGMFFEEKYYHESIVPLYEFSCNKCDFKVDDSIFVNQHLNNDDDDENKNGGKKKKKKPRRLLLDHLRVKHRLVMCQLCIDHKRDFISQLPRFKPHQLQTHMRNGDGPGSGFNGHPICEFCRPKRFYDVNFLYQHLHKEHYKCHICEKQGKDNQWFKNYGSLARHFEREHFLCQHPMCLEARFVVFENELDLKAHGEFLITVSLLTLILLHSSLVFLIMSFFRFSNFSVLFSSLSEISVHGGTSTGSTKINLEFNIRRRNGNSAGPRQNAPSESDFNYDLDGQAFVPPALTNEGTAGANNSNENSNAPNNTSSLHPQHVQRMEELRAQAAVVREQQALNSQVDSFPTLQTTAAPTPSSAPLVGWTSGTTLQHINRSNRNIGEVTSEAFPTLQSNASNKTKKKKANTGNIGATRRQFAAMTTSANQQQPSWGGGNTASSIGSLAPPSSSHGNRGNFFSSATPLRQMNRQADLAPDNFPSLSGTSSSSARQNFQRTAITATPPPSMNSALDFPTMQSNNQRAGNSVAKAMKKNLKPPPSMNSATDFPSMRSNDQSPAINSNWNVRNSSTADAAKKNLKPPPSISSVSDFPAPPSSQQSTKQTVRQKLMDDSEKKMPAQDKFAQAGMSKAASSAKATLEDMKASMGQKNFKQLKKLTKSFAQEELSPEGYIDQTATLFENGYDDPDFWSYLPSVLESFPNERSAMHALKYMDSLKRQQTQANDKKSAVSKKAVVRSSQWNGPCTKASNVMRQVVPPPLPAFRTATRPLTQPVMGATRPQTMPSKKKSAWGAGGNAKVVRTKAPPGSVGAAAAVQGPEGGSATKYMAKQQKKEQHASNNKQNKAKKKKQKNELRDLAFGK